MGTSSTRTTNGPLLSVEDLVVDFAASDGSSLRALEGVTFDLFRDEVLCLVGESGSGKTLTMLAAMGLLPANATVVSGSVTLNGRDLLAMNQKELSHARGSELSMIFQDPMSSLNPVMKIGSQIAEMIKLHRRDLPRNAVRARVVELLKLVRVPHADARASAYPHELSGGMRQRVMIAMAVAHNPSLLIADEPTTALDVTIQDQVLRLIQDLRREQGMSMVFITHDLGVVADIADRVAVMYSGRLVELGDVHSVFSTPAHPYTRGLLKSLLKMEIRSQNAYSIPGQPPSIANRPTGCAFNPRCELSEDLEYCSTHRPQLEALGNGQSSACFFPLESIAVGVPAGRGGAR